MNSFNPENIPQEHVDKLMPLHADYQAIQSKIVNLSKGSSLLLDWMIALVEFKMKKATMKSLQKAKRDVRDELFLI